MDFRNQITTIINCYIRLEFNDAIQCSQVDMFFNLDLLDRFDIHIEVPHVPRDQLYGQTGPASECSATVRERVVAARSRQLERAGKPNSALSPAEVQRFCALEAPERNLLETALERLGLSTRAWQRILKLARTIADLAEAEAIQASHLSEAIGYRSLDRAPTMAQS